MADFNFDEEVAGDTVVAVKSEPTGPRGLVSLRLAVGRFGSPWSENWCSSSTLKANDRAMDRAYTVNLPVWRLGVSELWEVTMRSHCKGLVVALVAAMVCAPCA
jgi:hypothetical protein